MPPVIRIGTRGSRLAMRQTEIVADHLKKGGIETETVIIKTEGDTTTGVPLHQVGGQGIFVRALDEAILRGEIDCAVHSMKDIPAARPDGIRTAAILPRDPPTDYMAFDRPLDEITSVGTSSTRRRAQLLRSDPSLDIRELRGNIDTRIRKLKSGEYDAIMLAEAGLVRMSLHLNGIRLPAAHFVPAPNQGTIAVVCRDTPELTDAILDLDHQDSRMDTMIERAVMEELGGGCFTPQGIYCFNGHLIAEVLSLEGLRTERMEEHVKTIEDAREIGRELRSRSLDLINDAKEKLGLEKP
ncbi:MAG: hydroxymethylbilane synthase [Methanocalculus sp. MSAO_Arc1]|uniref:hydroxymethylbilane synthase n=1 Tax=Methanocalculus TaxID=71151 RepID=UPI000FF00EFA|nr:MULTISPECIES: hydroxymethylbilane synthase [unclassified Methanocalculus]RQD79035.1 MAG: hydroxymethylbilane synthase [Methanocalculus sp. MSAO_Arc1]